ncbi:disulfide bond formation protein DsbA (plasmid) [Rhizobium sp. ACO-34A]|nr:thioredoxin domain-containing protein [Rhizobium sp. ACO-34A]ATN36780.1 disulfide bond formation protein DsbA [Rhizobium sp. ACO-34A]
MPIKPTSYRSLNYGVIILATALLSPLGLLAWHLADRAEPSASVVIGGNHTLQSFLSGPPWLLGQNDARYTLTLYADLECTFCKAYFPVLKSWIDGHPDTVLIWHHLPLSIHEPAATELATLAECVGKTGGQPAFWDAVTWIYRHTRSDGRGIPDGTNYPGLNDDTKACIASDGSRTSIQLQTQEGAADGVNATPTVKLQENASGKSLILPGPIEGDALLSALDLLSADETTGRSDHSKTPADPVGAPR